MRIDVGGYEMEAEIQLAQKPRHTAILLHGFAGTGHDWTPILPTLLPDTTAITVDLIGHGESDSPREMELYQFQDVSRALLKVADAVGAEAPVWIGYSFGGRLLYDFALRNPRRVGGIVWESAHPGLDDLKARNARATQDEEDARLLTERGLKPFLERWHERPVFESRKARKPVWQQEVKRKEETNSAAGLARCLRGLGLGHQPDYVPRLGDVKAPVMVVCGLFDTEYVRQARRILAALPLARIELVPYCGHGVHLEDPEHFQDLVREFMDNQRHGA